MLVIVLLSSVFVTTVNSAHSKEGTNDEGKGSFKSQAQSDISPADEKEYQDSDKNKILDALDEELKSKGDNYKKDVIVLLNVPLKEVGENVKMLKKIMGDFQAGEVYSVISGFSAKMSKKQIHGMSKLGLTVQIEPDREVKAFLDTSTAWFGAKQARIDFGVDGNVDGNASSYSSNDIVIAIIDTGIDPNHRDLNNGKIIGWRDFINGRSTPYDDNGHGTHVASIAAGEGEANPAYMGVAPGAALVGVKVLNSSGSGSTSGVISGVNWVVQNKNTYGINILNLSLGSSGCSNGLTV